MLLLYEAAIIQHLHWVCSCSYAAVSISAVMLHHPAIVAVVTAIMLYVISTQLRAATTPTNRSYQIIYSAIHHISYYSAHDIFYCIASHTQSIVACQLISVDVGIRMLHGYLLLVH